MRPSFYPNFSPHLTLLIISPFIGGVLSNPAEKYGSIFQNSVFSRHPYFLPCLVAGIIALSGVLIGYIYLEEVSTLPIRDIVALKISYSFHHIDSEKENQEW